MNPQATTTTTSSTAERLVRAHHAGIRPVVGATRIVRPKVPPLVAQITVDDAERDRQAALNFLHKLVLGNSED